MYTIIDIDGNPLFAHGVGFKTEAMADNFLNDWLSWAPAAQALAGWVVVKEKVRKRAKVIPANTDKEIVGNEA